MTYGYCVYHEIECDFKGNCIECPHNTVEDTEWFREDEELETLENENQKGEFTMKQITLKNYENIEDFIEKVENADTCDAIPSED